MLVLLKNEIQESKLTQNEWSNSYVYTIKWIGMLYITTEKRIRRRETAEKILLQS